MKTETLVRVLAGTMTLVSVALVHFFGPVWLLLTCFVGLNLLQSAVTGFCPPTWLLRKMGWVDAQDVIHWGGQR
ncbi:MAG TPA: DUF2892 domain-containing protein [Opitutaceae bacterium]|jgi:hypothetical protein|nr:DUF2892 domain-containing protein [Opitutaceae bacterium]HRE08501.1 DUF2892 domain-containing protein [Opitutaceae bacterium]